MEVREAHSDVDRRAIAGLRDVLAHAYFALDEDSLWKVVSVDVPAPLERLERIQRRGG